MKITSKEGRYIIEYVRTDGTNCTVQTIIPVIEREEWSTSAVWTDRRLPEVRFYRGTGTHRVFVGSVVCPDLPMPLPQPGVM